MFKFRNVSILVLFLFECIQGLSSGFYVDDGRSQTVFDRELSQEDMMNVSEQILKLLGLPDRPRINATHLKDGLLRKAASQFLLNAYHHLLVQDDAGDDETMVHARVRRSLDETEYEHLIDESDMIMTFESLHHSLPEYRHQREKTLGFDVSDVKPDNRLLSAELRIYINLTAADSFCLTIHRLEKNAKHFLTAYNITNWYQGWIKLNVTRALYAWLANKNENHELLITTDSGKKFNQIGVLMDNQNDHQPFIVGFFHTKGISNNQTPPSSSSSRIKRDTAQKNNKRTSTKFSSSSSSLPQKKKILTMGHHQNIKHHKSCQRQTLFVSFKDLKWSDWIIAPIGFHAFYCSGDCNFPLNSPTDPSNHAIVQTLVHLKHPKKVPKPCCVPTRLGHISVLYYLDDTNVNLQKYKNIVVKNCGCQ